MRIVVSIALLVSLAACQTTGFQRPYIPPGTSAADENRILCQESPASPWYVPCSDRWD